MVDPAHRHFTALTRDEQETAIRHLHAQGYSDYSIAAATRVAVEQVRAILAEPEPSEREMT